MTRHEIPPEAKAASSNRSVGRLGMILLAVVLVVALAAFFLLGNDNAPGPAAGNQAPQPTASETAQAMPQTAPVPAETAP